MADDTLKVLCVEDYDDERDLIKEVLKEYKVICVETIKEACRLLKTTEFALIIIDEHLPDGSGLGFCRDISAANAKAPIIMISGDDYMTRTRAVEAGARTFLAKGEPSFIDDLRFHAHALI